MEKKYNCSICNINFDSKTKLSKHLLTKKHINKKNQINNISKQDKETELKEICQQNKNILNELANLTQRNEESLQQHHNNNQIIISDLSNLVYTLERNINLENIKLENYIKDNNSKLDTLNDKVTYLENNIKIKENNHEIKKYNTLEIIYKNIPTIKFLSMGSISIYLMYLLKYSKYFKKK